MISLFAALFARLWFLQVMTAPEYQVAAENNRVRVVQVEAPRGRILDRNGMRARRATAGRSWSPSTGSATTGSSGPTSSSCSAGCPQVLTVDAARRATGELPAGDPAAQRGHHRRPERSRRAPRPSHDRRRPPRRRAGRHRVTGADRPKPVTVEQLEKRLADAALQPLQARPGGHRGERGPRDLPHRARRRVPDRRGGADHHPQLRVRAAPRPRPRLRRRDQRGGAGGRTRTTTKPYEEDDEIGKAGIERTMEAELRGTPGEVRYEVDARNVPVRRLEGGRKPMPGQRRLPLDRHQPPVPRREVARRADQGRRASDDVCDPDGCKDRRDLGQRRGAEPDGRVDPRHGVVPDLRPVGVHRRHQHRGLRRRSPRRATTSRSFNKAIAGAYAPGLDVEAVLGLRRAGQRADHAEHPGRTTPASTRCRTARRRRARTASARRLPRATRTGRSTSSSVAHPVERRLLLQARRRHVAAGATSSATTRWPEDLRASGASAPTPASTCPARPTAASPTRSGSAATPRTPTRATEAEIEDSAPGARATTSTRPSARATCWSRRCSWPTATPTFANGGTLYEPQLVLQVAKYESDTVLLGHRARSRCARSTCSPTWRAADPRGPQGRHAGRRAAPPPAPSPGSRRTSFRWPARPARPRSDQARQGQHLAVRGLRPGRRADARRRWPSSPRPAPAARPPRR